jgi:hypothetical protein
LIRKGFVFSDYTRGKHWYNNGYKNGFYFENEIPENFVKGRLKVTRPSGLKYNWNKK